MKNQALAKSAKEMYMTENELSKIILDTAMEIHKEIGPGLLESVYERILAFELENKGLNVRTQVSVPIKYKNIKINDAFRADIIVNDKVIIELKSVKALEAIHKKQLLTYLRLSDKRLGLLLNFNKILLKDGIKRIVNNLEN